MWVFRTQCVDLNLHVPMNFLFLDLFWTFFFNLEYFFYFKRSNEVVMNNLKVQLIVNNCKDFVETLLVFRIQCVKVYITTSSCLTEIL